MGDFVDGLRRRPNRPLGLGGLVALTILAAGACEGDSLAGPAGDACGPGPYFTVLPVPATNLESVPVVGGVDAPGHTLPTDHGAFFLNAADVPLTAPGDMTVTDIRRVRYSGSGAPPGEEDYAIFFQVCRELTGWFGHVVDLAPRFSPATLEYDDCRSYSTPFFDVETCEAHDVNLQVLAGDDIATAPGFADFGVVDERVTNFYISPQRWGGESHAVCMWEQWDSSNQATLFSRLRDLRRPAIDPVGEPRCGTMEVDVPNTAKGVWAHSSVTGPLAGDERNYMALVDYPYRPQLELALSLGLESLGARLAIVERRTSGRVNRAFEEVGPDGSIYCYGPTVEGFAPSSWLLQMTTSTAVRIEHVDHGVGESPCADDPATWRFGPTAVTMVR